VALPGVNGLQLLAKPREQTGDAELPAIFLSGRMRPEDIAGGRELDESDLTKPFVGNALLSAIDGLIDPRDRARSAGDDW
jgi:DNA-binding response OmpR family regulator